MRHILITWLAATMVACGGGGGGTAPVEGSFAPSEPTTTAQSPDKSCSINNGYDCHGHRIGRFSADSYTYLDNDDVVDVDVAFFVDTEVERDTREELQEIIDWINELYVEDGILINLKIKTVKKRSYSPSSLNSALGDTAKSSYDVGADIVVNYYAGSDNALARYPEKNFNSYGRVAMNEQRYLSTTAKMLAHELGHTYGLAHGPENYSNPDVGYVFSEFGHGWWVKAVSGVCIQDWGTIMSYAHRTANHSGSSAEMCGGAYRADDRLMTSDSVLAINLMRYEISTRR